LFLAAAPLIHLTKKINEIKKQPGQRRKDWADIVGRSLEAPLRQIADNAGVEGSIIVEKVRGTDFNTGYNAATGEFEDLIAAGIIDPAKVVRSALQNAGSIAGMVLTTEALVVEKPEKKAAAAPIWAAWAAWVYGWHGRHGRHGRHGHDVVRAHAPVVIKGNRIEKPLSSDRAFLLAGDILLSLKCSTLSCANRMVKNTSPPFRSVTKADIDFFYEQPGSLPGTLKISEDAAPPKLC